MPSYALLLICTKILLTLSLSFLKNNLIDIIVSGLLVHFASAQSSVDSFVFSSCGENCEVMGKYDYENQIISAVRLAL